MDFDLKSHTIKSKDLDNLTIQEIEHLVKEQKLKSDSKIINSNNRIYTLLEWMCTKGYLDIIKLLVNEANIGLQNTHNSTPLMLACESGNKDVVKFLVEKLEEWNKLEEQINLKDNDGDTAFICAGANKDANVIKFLIEKFEELNKLEEQIDLQDNDGYTVLMYACTKGHIEVAKFLIEKLEELDKLEEQIVLSDNKNHTVLMHTCAGGHIEVARFLIEKLEELDKLEEQIEIKEKNGLSILIRACINKHEDIVKFLVNKKHITKEEYNKAQSLLSHNIIKIRCCASIIIDVYQQQQRENKQKEKYDKQKKQQLIAKENRERNERIREQNEREKILFLQKLNNDYIFITNNKNLSYDNIDDDLLNLFISKWNSLSTEQQEEITNGFELFGFKKTKINKRLEQKNKEEKRLIVEKQKLIEEEKQKLKKNKLIKKIERFYLQKNFGFSSYKEDFINKSTTFQKITTLKEVFNCLKNIYEGKEDESFSIFFRKIVDKYNPEGDKKIITKEKINNMYNSIIHFGLSQLYEKKLGYVDNYIIEFEKNIVNLENLSEKELIRVEKSISEIKKIQEIEIKNINIKNDIYLYYNFLKTSLRSEALLSFKNEKEKENYYKFEKLILDLEEALNIENGLHNEINYLNSKKKSKKTDNELQTKEIKEKIEEKQEERIIFKRQQDLEKKEIINKQEEKSKIKQEKSRIEQINLENEYNNLKHNAYKLKIAIKYPEDSKLNKLEIPEIIKNNIQKDDKYKLLKIKTEYLNLIVDAIKNEKNRDIIKNINKLYTQYLELKGHRNQFVIDYKLTKLFERTNNYLKQNNCVETNNNIYIWKKIRNKIVYKQDITINKITNLINEYSNLVIQENSKEQLFRNTYFLKIYQVILNSNDQLLNIKSYVEEKKRKEKRELTYKEARFEIINSLEDNDVVKIIYNEFNYLRKNAMHNFYDINKKTFDRFINKLIELELVNKDQLELLDLEKKQIDDTLNTVNLTNSNINRNMVLNILRDLRPNGNGFINVGISPDNLISFQYDNNLNDEDIDIDGFNTVSFENIHNIGIVNFSEEQYMETNNIDNDGSYIVNLPNHFVAIRRITRDNQVYFFVIDSLNNKNNKLRQILSNKYPNANFISLQTDIIQQNPHRDNDDADHNACAIWAYTNTIALSQINTDILTNSINNGYINLPNVYNQTLLNNLINIDDDLDELLGSGKSKYFE